MRWIRNYNKKLMMKTIFKFIQNTLAGFLSQLFAATCGRLIGYKPKLIIVSLLLL